MADLPSAHTNWSDGLLAGPCALPRNAAETLVWAGRLVDEWEQRQMFAERLRREMAGRQITQAELGEALGRTQTAVSYWTTGKRQPSLEDLCKLADYFDTSTDYLLGRVGHD